MRQEPLAQALRRLWLRTRSRTPPKGGPPGLKPCCPFDALLDQRQNDLERGLEEVRGRINGLLFLLAGTVLTQVVLKLIG